MKKISLVESQSTGFSLESLKNLSFSKLSPFYIISELIQEIPKLGPLISFPMEKINRIREADPKSEEFAYLFDDLYGYQFPYDEENITKAKNYVDWQTEHIKAVEAFMNFVFVLIAMYVLIHFGGFASSDSAEVEKNEDTIIEVDGNVAAEPTVLPPASDAVAAPLTVESQPTEVASQPIVRQTYTVQSGDNLTRIAQRFNVTVADLVLWNQSLIWDQDMIRVGWVLNVSP